MFRKYIATFIFILYFCNVSGEFFVSTAWLSASKMTAVNLVKFIDKVVKNEEVSKGVENKNKTVNSRQEEVIRGQLKRISSKLKTQLSAEINGTKPVPSNPISMYKYAKVTSEATIVIKGLLNWVKNHTHLKAIDVLFLSNLPQREDVIGILKSFTRLQNTYNLTSEEMAYGDVFGIKIESLSELDCYHIGQFINNSGHANIGMQWFQTSLSKVLKDDNFTAQGTQLRKSLYKITKTAKQKEKEENNNNNEKNSEPNTKESDSSTKSDKIKVEPQQRDLNINTYWSICAKKHLGVKGYCKYSEIKDLPFFERPMKIEYIHDSPRILLVHDVVDQNLIDYLTENYLLLQRSTIINAGKNKVGRIGSDSRISSTYALMNDMEQPQVLEFYDQLERLTGLRMNDAQGEHLQVVNYGIGGEYRPHFDWINEKILKSGATHTGTNRILTVIAYLSDVEVGGSTVFPLLGISVAPVKGSALIFTNLDDKWQGDQQALHAGCPVFVGSKWIATKWVHTKGQDKNFLKTVPSIWT